MFQVNVFEEINIAHIEAQMTTIDSRNRDEFAQEITKALRKRGSLELDMKIVHFIDSSIIALLVDTRRLIGIANFSLVGITARLRLILAARAPQLLDSNAG